MSLTKSELTEIKQKLQKADEEQVREIAGELGYHEAADKIYERIREKRSVRCPDCDEREKLIKYGTDRHGNTRLKCKSCKRTFLKDHGLPHHKSHCSENEFKEFLTSMLRDATLQELAEAYDINIETAFNWRHNFLDYIQELQEDVWLAGRVWADETQLSKNEPGPSGEDSQNKRESIAILTAKDYKGRTVVQPTSDGGMGKARDIEPTFKKYLVEENTTLATDGAGNFEKYCNDNSVDHEVFGSKSDDMDMVNWLHSKFKNWYAQFRGVGSKYMPKYCAWFSFLENDEELKVLLA